VYKNVYIIHIINHICLVYKITAINAACRLVSGSKKGYRGWKTVGKHCITLYVAWQ